MSNFLLRKVKVKGKLSYCPKKVNVKRFLLVIFFKFMRKCE